MHGRRFEILPLCDDPEDYTWTSPEQAEYFTVYERDEENLAQAKADLRTLDDALVFTMRQHPGQVLLWTGEMYVEVSTPWAHSLLRVQKPVDVSSGRSTN